MNYRAVFDAATSYRVDRLRSNVWTAATTLRASGAAAAPNVWVDSSGSVGEAYRVVALPAGREVILKTVTGNNQSDAVNFLPTLSISLDQAEPIAGKARFTVAGSLPGGSVTWFVYTGASLDSGASSGTEGSGTAYAYEVNAQQLTDGAHLIRAMVQPTATTWIDLRRQVSVDDPHFTLEGAVDTTGPSNITLTAFASSEANIATVQALVDGQAIGNMPYFEVGCTSGHGFRPCYSLNLPYSTLAFGDHQFQAIVTDARGLVREWTQTFNVNNAPVVTLSNPALNAIVTGANLPVIGVVADDSATVVSTIKLDGTVVASNLPKGAFQFAVDLAPYAAGVHTLEVASTDAQGRDATLTRRFRIQAPGAFSFERLADQIVSLDENAVDGTAVIVRAEATAPIDVLNFGPSGQAVRLQNSSTASSYPTVWLSQSAASVIATAPVGSPLAFHLIRWGRDGAYHDFTIESSGLPAHSVQGFNAAGDWLAWSYTVANSSAIAIALQNLVTGEKHVIALPDGTATLVRTDAVVPYGGTSSRLVFYASSGGTPRRYVYDTVTKQSRAMSVLPSAALYSISNHQSDGTRLLWREDLNSAGGSGVATGRLMAESVADPGVATALSTGIQWGRGFVARPGGMVAWTDRAADNSLVLRVDTGAGISTITSGHQSTLAVGGGGVAYTDANGSLFLWTAVTGSRLVYSGITSRLALTGGWLYFTTSLESSSAGSTSLYRVAF